MQGLFKVLYGAAIFAAFLVFFVYAVLQVLLWWGKPSWELAFWLVSSFLTALFWARVIFYPGNREP